MAEAKGIIPHLVVDDAAAAIEFYKQAFGATELMRLPAQDGKRLMHAGLTINGTSLFLRDDFPEHSDHGNDKMAPPKRLGGTSVTMHLDVANCDEAVKRATAAGAKVLMEPWDAFWGDRYGMVADPFGHTWSFAHPLPGKAA
jgi:PhnB protein